jgi:hypothetical protein
MARDMWGPVTTAWRILRLRIEEQPPVWKVAANVLNKQSRTADKKWSSSLGVGRDTTPHRRNVSCYETFTEKASDPDRYFGSEHVQAAGTCECGNEPSGSM